jgi:hypothetical protein
MSDQPAPVVFHWIMTVQTTSGHQGTNNGLVTATPGMHTHESTYASVLKGMEEWIGTPQISVLFFSLEPNTLPVPAVTA